MKKDNLLFFPESVSSFQWGIISLYIHRFMSIFCKKQLIGTCNLLVYMYKNIIYNFIYNIIYIDIQKKHYHLNVSTEVFISNSLQIKWS